MTDEDKNEEKNGFEQIAAFFGEAVAAIVDNISENFREVYEEVSKEYALQRKVRNKERAEDNGETLEKIALYNELDFRAGFPITTTEIQTRCPECGEHNTKGHQQ